MAGCQWARHDEFGRHGPYGAQPTAGTLRPLDSRRRALHSVNERAGGYLGADGLHNPSTRPPAHRSCRIRTKLEATRGPAKPTRRPRPSLETVPLHEIAP